MKAPGALSLLSVVVIGRNESQRLRACLESVQQMRLGSYELELLYIDSGSTDASIALAESLDVKVIALQPQRPTAALARNAGWTAARGEIILFLDGDTVLDASFVQKALPAFDDPAIAVVWGHRRESHPEASIYNRVLDLDWMYPPGPAEFCGGDALMRRSVLEEVGGFDPALIAGEEPEMCRRILARGYGIQHVDLPMTQHDLAITSFGQYLRRASRAGHAYAEVSSRFAHTAAPFWSDDVRRNRNRALLFLCAAIILLLLTVTLRSAWPVAVAFVLAALIVVRTAYKARWKSKSLVTLLLYGVHAQVQQLPIYFGQLQFRRNQRQGTPSGLVDYKRS